MTRLQGTIVAGVWQGCDCDGPLDFGPSEAKEQNPRESSDREYKTESVSMNQATEFSRPLLSFHDRVQEKIEMWRMTNKIPWNSNLDPASNLRPCKGTVMLVTWRWWQFPKFNLGDILWMLVTKMANTVTNSSKLSSTHYVSNIGQQHRCYHLIYCLPRNIIDRTISI